LNFSPNPLKLITSLAINPMNIRLFPLILGCFGLLIVGCGTFFHETNPSTSTQNLNSQVINRVGDGGTVNIGVTSENSELVPVMEQALKAQGLSNYVIQKGGSFIVAQALCDNQLDAVMVADNNLIEATCPGQFSLGSMDLYTTYVEFWASSVVLKKLGFFNREVGLNEIVAVLAKPVAKGGMCLASSVPIYSKSGNTAYMAFAGANHNNEPQFTPQTLPTLKSIYENRCLSSESTAWLMEKAYNQGNEWLTQNQALVVGYSTLFNRPFTNHSVVDFRTRDLAPIKLKTPLQVVPTAFWRQENHAEKFRRVFQSVSQSEIAQSLDQVPAVKKSNVLRPFSGTSLRAGINFYNAQVRNLAGWVLVLDVSGSMEGEGLDGLKRGAVALVNPDNAKKYGLYRPDDSFSVLTFSGETKQLSGNSRDQLTQDLSQLQADGGTYLFNAAQQAIEFVPKNGTGIVVFFSDGAPSDEPNPALVERYQRFTQQEGGKVIFVAVGNIDPDQVKIVASALSATPIYSQNVNETAQQFLKGIADAL